MIETSVNPQIMISKLKKVREKMNEIGTNASLHRDIYKGYLENINQVISELEVLQEDMENYEDLGNN